MSDTETFWFSQQNELSQHYLGYWDSEVFFNIHKFIPLRKMFIKIYCMKGMVIISQPYSIHFTLELLSVVHTTQCE